MKTVQYEDHVKVFGAPAGRVELACLKRAVMNCAGGSIGSVDFEPPTSPLDGLRLFSVVLAELDSGQPVTVNRGIRTIPFQGPPPQPMAA